VAKAGATPWERLGAMIEAYFAAGVFSSEKLASGSASGSILISAIIPYRRGQVERRYHREIEPEVTRLLATASAPEADKEAARITGMLTAMLTATGCRRCSIQGVSSQGRLSACLEFLRIAIDKA